MRVAIEAGSLTLTSGGLARYTSELSLALARCFPLDEFVLLTDRPFPMPPAAPVNLKRGGGARNAMERRWWLWGIARELDSLRADVVHGPDFSVPYIPRRPSVMTVHDLSPWMDPGWHAAAQRVARRTPVLLEMGIATMVITPSESVRRQAIERFQLRPDRVVAIPEAAPSWLRPVAVAENAGAPYFLFVGTLEPRKNLPLLIDAWREVRRERRIDLVLAGRRRADCPPLPEEPGLRFLGEVADRDLAGLYSGAVAFVYPSLYEGFGLPVVEAMQCGACVIASRAVAETAGDAAVYAESVSELAAAMRRAAADPGWRAGRQALSLGRAREFSWDRGARLTREVYEEARRRFAD
jgi:glycosyltransferase involved in cell wall biosynthesis